MTEAQTNTSPEIPISASVTNSKGFRHKKGEAVRFDTLKPTSYNFEPNY